MNQELIIVGAGISGLSAGIYAQMNGFRSTIYEIHTIPGGLCTAWERKGSASTASGPGGALDGGPVDRSFHRDGHSSPYGSAGYSTPVQAAGKKVPCDQLFLIIL